MNDEWAYSDMHAPKFPDEFDSIEEFSQWIEEKTNEFMEDLCHSQNF